MQVIIMLSNHRQVISKYFFLYCSCHSHNAINILITGQWCNRAVYTRREQPSGDVLDAVAPSLAGLDPTFLTPLSRYCPILLQTLPAKVPPTTNYHRTSIARAGRF